MERSLSPNNPLSHTVTRVEELELLERKGKTPAVALFDGGYSSKVIFFPQGHAIEVHSHNKGPLYKIVISGAIEYDNFNQLLLPGEIGTVEGGVSYEGRALRDTYLLLLSPE